MASQGLLKKIPISSSLLLTILLSFASLFFIWTIYGVFQNKAEIRQNLQLIDQPITYNSNLLHEYVATIINTGDYDARNLHIILSIKNGSILKILVTSKEKYSILDTPTRSVSKELFFANFTPNSIAQIGIWTISAKDKGYSVPQLYTTFYGGIAQPYTIEGIENTKTNLNGRPTILWSKFQERVFQLSLLNNFPRKAEKYGIYNLNELTLENQEFYWLAIIIAILTLPFWLFTPRAWAVIITTILISISLWLFTNITVNINWIIIFVYLAFFTSRFAKRDAVRILLALTSIPMVLLYFSSVTLNTTA